MNSSYLAPPKANKIQPIRSSVQTEDQWGDYKEGGEDDALI